MALTSRLSHPPTTTTDPEDHFASSLGVIFPDDVTNQHSAPDDANTILYTSPHLPSPISLRLACAHEEADRYLFSHYLWNAGLLLAELIEADTLKLPPPPPPPATDTAREKTAIAPGAGMFDVSGLRTIEFGAGTGLPSIVAALAGARGVVATDYPSRVVLEALQGNLDAAVQEKKAAAGAFTVEEVRVEGHAWGELDTAFAQEGRGRFDRVMAADVLWMPWQHENLRRSIAWFLKEGRSAKAWVIGGFHTGRETTGAFFEREALAEVGLEVEHLWERDCDGLEREWAWDRGMEEASIRKRWLAVGVLRRITLGESVPS